MNKLPITILGAGNVGCAMAAHATLQGYPVTLWVHPDHATYGDSGADKPDRSRLSAAWHLLFDKWAYVIR